MNECQWVSCRTSINECQRMSCWTSVNECDVKLATTIVKLLENSAAIRVWTSWWRSRRQISVCRGGYSNIVWSTTPQLADELKQLSPSAFAERVNEALQGGQPSSAAKHVASLFRRNHSSSDWVAPPVVHAWAGQPPSAFPLHLRHAGRHGLLVHSVAVLAEIPLRSPRKLFIFIIKKIIYRIKVSKNQLI